MRLYPPVPHYFRKISEDIVLKGHVIPKGNYSSERCAVLKHELYRLLISIDYVYVSHVDTMVCIGAFELHRQPDLWENPEVNDCAVCKTACAKCTKVNIVILYP